jgi:hypothetical protein
MNLENMPREAWVALIVLVILALGFDPGFFVLLFLAVLLYLARNMLENGGQSNQYQPPQVSTRSSRSHRQPVYEDDIYEEACL